MSLVIINGFNTQNFSITNLIFRVGQNIQDLRDGLVCFRDLDNGNGISPSHDHSKCKFQIVETKLHQTFNCI